MIKAIIFDCFGVLTTDLLMEFTSTLPANVMSGVHELIHKRSSGQLSRDKFVNELSFLTNHSKHEINKVTTPGGVKNIKLLKLIEDLKNNKYKIGLLSNVGSDWVKKEFLTDIEQKLFDDILLSYEVNLIKPDPLIFKLAAERLDVKTNECVLIDDIESYCLAAKKEGMQTITYKTFENTKQELESILSNQ